jgi:pimeloyl-ACP methyl ester carboxylesterase
MKLLESLKQNPKKYFKKISTFVIVILALYLAASAYLFTQASTVIYSYHYSKFVDYKTPTTHNTVTNKDGDKIDLLSTTKPGSTKYFLYLHGTWGRLNYIVDGLSQYGNVLSVAYPGYSESTGTSSTDKLNESAELGLKYLTDKGVSLKDITVFGHSLGGSPALYLAKNENINKIIIINTFYSMKKMCEIQYSALCIFGGSIHPSFEYARVAKAPIVHFHSPTDEFIPFKQGVDLEAEIASNSHQMHQIKGTHGEFSVEEVMEKAGFIK